MKTFSIFKSIPMVIGFIALFIIFITSTSYSQNTDKKEKKKTVILKVTADKDGKTTVVDTTYTTTGEPDQDEIEEITEEIRKEMKGVEKEIEDEMQVRVLIDLPDSAMMDSLDKIIKKMVVLKKGLKNCVKIVSRKPQGFEYEFNVPCPPGHLPRPENFDAPGFCKYWGDPEKRVFRFENKGRTLNDILGEIPIEKVRNYSIKNTKYGKKIVIELED